MTRTSIYVTVDVDGGIIIDQTSVVLFNIISLLQNDIFNIFQGHYLYIAEPWAGYTTWTSLESRTG